MYSRQKALRKTQKRGYEFGMGGFKPDSETISVSAEETTGFTDADKCAELVHSKC